MAEEASEDNENSAVTEPSPCSVNQQVDDEEQRVTSVVVTHATITLLMAHGTHIR